MKFKFAITQKIVFEYIMMTIGTALMGLALGTILIEAKVVPGGASGIAMGIHYLIGKKISVGALMWIINVPLFIWGIKVLDASFGFKTFYGFTMSSIFIDFFSGSLFGIKTVNFTTHPTVEALFQNDFLFLIICSATIMGIGSGLVFKFKGSTAGTDIIVAIIHKNFGIKPGQANLLINVFIIFGTGLIVSAKGLSPDKSGFILSLYAIFLLYIMTRIVDMIIDGLDYARQVFITSDKHQEIGEAIMHNLSRGATALKSRGLYRDVATETIMTVISVKELGKLEHIVKDIDPKAFMVINNAHEVQGQGFRRRI